MSFWLSFFLWQFFPHLLSHSFIINFIFSDGSRTKLFTVKSELEISSVERAHHGKGFVCSIRQDGKEVQRVSVTPAINVKWAPENTKITAKDVYLEKSAVSLSCESTKAKIFNLNIKKFILFIIFYAFLAVQVGQIIICIETESTIWPPLNK